MGTCTFCYRETHTGEGSEHSMCRDEFDRRNGASRCLTCGELPMAPGSTACHDCSGMCVVGGLPQFRNYPGGR